MPLRSRARQLDDALSPIREKRAALLYDIARQIAPSGLSPEELQDRELRRRYLLLTGGRDGAQPPARLSVGGAPCNREALLQHLTLEWETDCVLLCGILARMAGLPADLHPESLTQTLLPCPEPDGEEAEAQEGEEENRVVYLRSSYTDDAYLRFSEVIPELRADYATSFSGVCEAVYYRQSALCMLPIENTSDGALTGFRNLIARHGLKIFCTCDVLSGDEQYTRFALLKKTLIPLPGQICDSPEHFIRLVLDSEGDMTPEQVLNAARICALPLYKADTVPTPHGKDRFAYDITLRTDGDLPAFLIWLMLEAPEVEIVGLYPHLAADE